MAEASEGKKLSGRVGIVTGASSGIGLAVAKALAGEGMQVVMVSRSVTAELAASVPGAVAMKCDVTNRVCPPFLPSIVH